MSGKRRVAKLLGPVTWVEVASADYGKITRAIMRGDKELVIELVCGEYCYSVELKRQTGEGFDGHWTCQSSGRTYRDSVGARVFSTSSGCFLVGKWHEDGESYYWWAELVSVDHFPDERPA
jgi:hypothetical protein